MSDEWIIKILRTAPAHLLPTLRRGTDDVCPGRPQSTPPTPRSPLLIQWFPFLLEFSISLSDRWHVTPDNAGLCVCFSEFSTDRQKGYHIIIVNHIWQSYWADMVNQAPPRVDEVSTDVWSTWVYVGALKHMSGWFDLTVEKKEEKKRNISETLQKVVLFQNFQWGPGSFQTPNFVYTVWKSYPTLTFKLMKHQCLRENERVPSLVR